MNKENMPSDLTKKAVEMLLKGATLLKEPCPYCSGVRVMKDGHALCVSCGREPQKENIESKTESKNDTITILEDKLASLSKELKDEKDHVKQQEIIKSINALAETIKMLKK